MKKRTRASRTPPARDEPIRNTTGAPGGNGASADDGYTYGTAVDQSLRSVRMLVEAGNTTALKAVERGVETAYMVIDEYMRLGRETARRFGQRTEQRTEGDGMNRPGDGGNAWGPWGPMTPMMGPWMQMMRMWGDTMTQFAPRAWNGADGMNPFMAFGPRAVTSVRVSSEAPVEVTVDIEPGAERAKLSVEPLRHLTDDDVPALATASIKWKKERLRVRLTVPSDQPAGEYAGDILDDAGIRRGQLRVEIDGAKDASRS